MLEVKQFETNENETTEEALADSIGANYIIAPDSTRIFSFIETIL